MGRVGAGSERVGGERRRQCEAEEAGRMGCSRVNIAWCWLVVSGVVSCWGWGKRLVDGEIDDNGSMEKGGHTPRCGQREAQVLLEQSQLRGFGRDGGPMRRRQRIESVAMLSHVAKLSPFA